MTTVLLPATLAAASALSPPPPSAQSPQSMYTEAAMEQSIRDDPWVMGVLLSFAATLAGTLGKHCFRLAALRASCKWHVLGLLLGVVVDPLLGMVAFSFGTQTVVSACVAFVILWNVTLAPALLGETLTKLRVNACALLFVGTVAVGIFGPHSQVLRTEAEYLALLASPSALVYFGLLNAWMAYSAWRWRREGAQGQLWGAVLGGSLGGNNFAVKCFVEVLGCALQYRRDGVAHAGCSEENPWTQGYLYFFAMLAAAVAAGSLLVLAITLRTSEALDAVTVFTGCQIVVAAASGNLVMQESVVSSPAAVACYCLSMAVTLAGLLLLVARELGWPVRLHDEEFRWANACELSCASPSACCASAVRSMRRMVGLPVDGGSDHGGEATKRGSEGAASPPDAAALGARARDEAAQRASAPTEASALLSGASPPPRPTAALPNV
jgi:hypothetical protein